MPTLTNLILDVRARVVEPVARFFTDAEITRWLNQGYKSFVNYAQPCEKVKAYAALAKKQVYDLPSDTLTLEKVNWEQRFPLLCTDETEFRMRMFQSPATSTSRPFMYTQYPSYGVNSQIQIWPGLATASVTTNLTDDVNSSVTTIPVDSTTGFPTQGFIIIGDEQIRYWDLDDTNFLLCERGHGFTTAASYDGPSTEFDGDTVTYAPIQMHYRYTPPDLSSGSDSPRMPEAWQEALICYATGNALQKRSEFPQADKFFQQYNAIREEAKLVRERMQIDRPVRFMEDDAADMIGGF